MRLSIGIACYPTFGGSGIVATEIGLGMAKRGHRVHFISSEVPVRLSWHENVFFHAVNGATYPLLRHGDYSLALASKLVDVATHEGLDLMHVHYAVPHATSAFLARQVLGPKAPPVVTTLHGTDITLVGTDPSYLPITRYAIEQSQAVTTPSAFLKQTTYDRLKLSDSVSIDVIENFVDTDRYRPPVVRDRQCFESLCPRRSVPSGDPVLFHVSNFRPVKRIMDVIDIFAAVNAARPSRLVMVGDGPERAKAEQRVRGLGLKSRVCFLGRQDDFVELLAQADVFLMPSESESFGLAALEALSCGVPVVGTRVGGLEALVASDRGSLHEIGDVTAMAGATLRYLGDAEVHQAAREAARRAALANWQKAPMLDRYEACYRRVVSACSSTRPEPS